MYFLKVYFLTIYSLKMCFKVYFLQMYFSKVCYLKYSLRKCSFWKCDFWKCILAQPLFGEESLPSFIIFVTINHLCHNCCDNLQFTFQPGGCSARGASRCDLCQGTIFDDTGKIFIFYLWWPRQGFLFLSFDDPGKILNIFYPNCLMTQAIFFWLFPFNPGWIPCNCL